LKLESRSNCPNIATADAKRKFRYKAPDKDVSRKIELPFVDNKGNNVSSDFRFASAVAISCIRILSSYRNHFIESRHRVPCAHISGVFCIIIDAGKVDELKYQKKEKVSVKPTGSDELLTVKLRYKFVISSLTLEIRIPE